MTTPTPAPAPAPAAAAPGPLWVNDSGEIACPRHGGAYLTSAVQARPRARTHSTPLGTWQRLTAEDVTALAADFAAADLPAPACPGCAPAPTEPAVRPEPGRTGTGTRREVHCETCGHPVNDRRADTCARKGHVVSVVDLTVTTFNAPTARPFTAEPAPYLGHTPLAR